MSIAAEVVNCEVQTKNKYCFFAMEVMCCQKGSKYVFALHRLPPSLLLLHLQRQACNLQAAN